MADKGILDNPAPDAAALLAACRRRGAELRRNVARVAEALAAGRSGPLTDRERALTGSMLHRLVMQIEADLHGRLCEGLCEDPDLSPADLDRFAAAPSGAGESLLPAALDPDLVEAALHRMFEHRLESALQPAQDMWGDGRAAPKAMPRTPQDRALAEKWAEYEVDRTRRSNGYGDPVLRPEELDPAPVARLCWRLGASLRGRAAAALGIAAEALDGTIAAATGATIAGMAAAGGAPSAADRLADALSEAGELDGIAAVEALRQGNLPLFFVLLQRLAGLPAALVRRLVFDADPLGLAAAARCSGLDAAQFEEVRRLTRIEPAAARPGTPRETFERLSPDVAGRICAYWRLPGAYLAALWQEQEGASAR